MEKLLAYILALIMICAVTTACSSTFGTDDGMEGGISLNIGDYILLGKYYDAPVLSQCADIDENGMLML
ncbi:MAG: hypothetical protein FWF04_05660, partial [Clostridiales bacterium]|nr:hypothetical protein [Clostridiales bacterium]